jgi:stage V sporulation protein D (sporulation-specific penicillin-binding protein)
VVNNQYGNAVMASFVGIAPIEDPRLAILFIADEPYGVHFGSLTAAPYAGKIMEETLRYLNIKPTQAVEQDEQAPAETVQMPDITGQSYDQAGQIIEDLGLLQKVMPEGSAADFTVVDQYPKAGEAVLKGNTVYIYSE